jgi:hypothetical protein
MNANSDMEKLKALPQEELAILYCEGIVEQMLRKRAEADAQRPEESNAP